MLSYTQLVFLVKFILQLLIWKKIFGEGFMSEYEDKGKTGFNLAENTYSQTLTKYMIWDVLVMLIIILHQYYLIRVGLANT